MKIETWLLELIARLKQEASLKTIAFLPAFPAGRISNPLRQVSCSVGVRDVQYHAGKGIQQIKLKIICYVPPDLGGQVCIATLMEVLEVFVRKENFPVTGTSFEELAHQSSPSAFRQSVTVLLNGSVLEGGANPETSVKRYHSFQVTVKESEKNLEQVSFLPEEISRIAEEKLEQAAGGTGLSVSEVRQVVSGYLAALCYQGVLAKFSLPETKEKEEAIWVSITINPIYVPTEISVSFDVAYGREKSGQL